MSRDGEIRHIRMKDHEGRMHFDINDFAKAVQAAIDQNEDEQLIEELRKEKIDLLKLCAEITEEYHSKYAEYPKEILADLNDALTDYNYMYDQDPPSARKATLAICIDVLLQLVEQKGLPRITDN